MAYRIAIAIAACIAMPAHADPEPTGYLELSLGLAVRGASSGNPDHELGGGAVVGFGAGTRWQGDLWLRGGLYAGPAIGDITRGQVVEGRLGIERRWTPQRSGVYVGVDVAVCFEDVVDDPDEATMVAVMAIPRAGIVLGGAVQFRFGVGLALGVGRVHDREPDAQLDAVTYSFAGGLDIDAALTFGF